MSKLVNIPSYHDINSINYLLLVIKDLKDNNNSCSYESLKRICQSRIFGGKPIDFKKILELSKHISLITQIGSTISLTRFGEEFILKNSNNTYEISSLQINYLIENFIFSGPWKSNCRGFFLNFTPNYKLVTFEFLLQENSLPDKYTSLFSLLSRFEIVETTADAIYVKPSFVMHVKELLSGKKISQEELRKLLDADEKLGLQAELVVLEYEKTRLIKLGRNPEAVLVRRISQLDVAAGYDIESFDGDIPNLIPNRFIEVKASKQSKVRFYWSKNEYEKAKELGDNYWVYFIGNFNLNSDDVEPIMIQNPIKIVQAEKRFKINVSKYLVEEI